MVYATHNDPSCYPGTQVLRNKAGLTSQAELDEFELAMTLIRADEAWPKGRFDERHYRAFHYHFFQDVYDWAGEYRSIRIGKAGNWFCYPEYVAREMRRLFGWLEQERVFSGLDLNDFRSKAAHFLTELNAIHPFRDGNGRTQMAFLAHLTEFSGYRFVDDALVPAQVIQAMTDSFSGNLAPLERLLTSLIAKG